MATEAEHQRQADHNQSLLDALDWQRFPDWGATVAFYKAVHLVEKLFTKLRISSGSHGTRNGVLKRRFPGVWKDYRPLYHFSRMARYWCMSVDGSQTEYILRRLRRVEKHISDLLI